MAQDNFYDQIIEGPIFLLLGQNYLRVEDGTDHFLSIALNKFNCPTTPPIHYEQLLHGNAHNDIEAALRWMEERCAHLPAPEWLTTVAQLPWNGFYTSAIDIIWPHVFENEWRNIQPLVDEKLNPLNPRNPASPYSTFLFGSISRDEESERPPLNPRELKNRNLVATRLISRLPDFVTPFGTLIIEGYAGSLDWLKPDTLTATIDNLHARPTHIFSVTGVLTEEFQGNDDIVELIKEKKLVLHTESLAKCLLEGINQNRLILKDLTPSVAEGRRISIETGYLTVPADLWRQVSRTATILDDTIMLPALENSPEKEYADFRVFLGGSNQKAVWSGINRKFAFTREYENDLYIKVSRLLKAKRTPSNPIIVHGQTGTGKTVALRALARKFRGEKMYPVLFIEQRTQGDINHFAIDKFCKWAQENGVSTCLIIWDGMVEIEQYSDLLKYLDGTGRKVVVIGSCYRLMSSIKVKAPDQVFEAPDRLVEKTELPRFNEFLKRFNVSLSQTNNSYSKRQPDDTFLTTLYHLLPETKPRIKKGLLDEFYIAEQRLNKVVEEENLDPMFDTVLAYELYKNGWIDIQKLSLSNETKEFSNEELSEIKRLTGLVMVPGSLGLKVPLELLLHVLDKLDQNRFIDILRNSDIFQCVPDDAGNYLVMPRHQLEAQIFNLNRIGGSSYEIEYMQALLEGINDNGEISNNPEVQFAVDLLRRVRPDEQTAKTDNRYKVGKKYVRYFRDLAETLGKLRKERSICNPRLMLQEATLLREYVISRNKQNRTNTETEVEDTEVLSSEDVDLPDDALTLLGQAEDIVRDAIDLIEADRKNAKFRSRLLVELAAILGTEMTAMLRENDDPEAALELFQDIRKEVLIARAMDAENFYPIDVFSWVTMTIMNKGILSEEEQLEIEADILHVFEMVNIEDFDFNQIERFHSRRMNIAKLLNKQEITKEAFDSLEKIGSYAGYYLTAYYKAGYQPGDLVNVIVDEKRLPLCKQAADYLEEQRQTTKIDGKCLYLLLRLWWMSRTGVPIFYNEEGQTLPFTQEEWRYCLNLLNELRRAGNEEEYNTPHINYLRGLATFHLNQIDEAFEIFSEVEREADTVQGVGRRRYKYLASSNNGEAIEYRGTIRWLDKNLDKSKVFVEGIRRIIPFYPREFSNQEIRDRGLLLFCIAFNFLGPIAVSTNRSKLKQGRTDEQRGS
jgi:hypothetical protein